MYTRREIERAGDDLKGFLRRVLADRLEDVKRGRTILHVPRPAGKLPEEGAGHTHPVAELFFQLQGRNHFRFPEQDLALPPGHVCLVPRCVAHRERRELHDGRYAHICSTLDGTGYGFHLYVLPAPGEKARVRAARQPTVKAPVLSDFADELAHAAHERRAFRRDLVRGLFVSLLASLHAILEAGPEQAGPAPVRDCRDLVDRQLGDPALTVGQLARQLGLHPDYLSRLFRQEAGLTLKQYIAHARITLGKDLLRATRLPVKEIAHTVGFADHAYFSKVFKTDVGKTPRAFRDESGTAG
ncbi:MAG: helix-turn-helix domain-containing protein [Kiritimatiellae bacterium]|nr:helix-turn-helix domain-containing protein [Kiritimatiellia bacterium]